MKGEEAQTQISFVAYVRARHKTIIISENDIGVHSAGRRAMLQAQKAKAMGYCVGIPDITIYEPRGGYHGAMIEFKSPKGRLRDEQKIMIERFKNKGYAVSVQRDVTEAIGWFERYLLCSLREDDK